MKKEPLRICLVDMNNGVANQGTRCFRRIVDALKVRAKTANPGLEVTFQHVQPRNLGELPAPDADLILGSGGPGSPFDGFDDAWGLGFRKTLDLVAEKNAAKVPGAPAAMLVCHSFELATIHFKVATMRLRPQGCRFGIMPAYATEEGKHSAVFQYFGDRIFAFENRHWEAVDLDQKRLSELGGRLLARESRPGKHDKGEALTAFEFAPGIVGTQFHPEADRAGVMAWVNRPATATEVTQAYGEAVYKRMVKTMDDPHRVARTFAFVIPGWLTERFNALAELRGWVKLGEPIQDMDEFRSETNAAAV